MISLKVLLLITIFLPAATAVVTGFGGTKSRCWALGGALATLICAICLAVKFPANAAEFVSTQTDWHWFGALGTSLNIQFAVGLDGLGLWLFVLTALLLVVAVLVSWEAIQDQERLYYRLLLLLGTGMLGVFVARDIILFYLFFEFTLVPLFFLIGIWGSDQRRYAAIKFFLFTLAGSVLTLAGLLTIVLWDYWHIGHGSHMTFSIPELTEHLKQSAAAGYPMSTTLQMWLFLALFAGFAIKVPLFPLHTWLPLAHTEAPAAGSILLAGILLKIGTYGFLRFNLPMLPEGTAVCMPWLLWLSVAGIVYGALVALAQSDMKKLIAYSSVSHLGFCMLGIFALNRVAVQGGTLQMINHGLSTGGLFAIVGMMYERYHTRRIADFGGIAAETPILAFFMVFMTLASIGLPGLNGFAGEFLLLIGMFQRAWGTAATEWTAQYRIISVLAVSGVVLGAWYMLWLVMRVFFGPLRERKDGHPIHDLKFREIAALVPLCVVIVWIGVHPKFFLDRMAPTIDQLTGKAMTAVESTQPPTAPSDESQPADEITQGPNGRENENGKQSVSKEASGDQRVEKVTQSREAAKSQKKRNAAAGKNVGQVTFPCQLNQFCLSDPRGSDRSRLCAFAPLRETFLGLNSPDRFPLEIARVA
jgi:NADH-quinone oxidoreductase subunit M